MLPWWGLYTGSWANAVMGTFAFVLLMVAHELGHALIARWRGLAVDEIEMFFLHGRCVCEVPDHEIDAIWVAWGGVLGQGVLFVFALFVSLSLQGVAGWLSPLFAVLIYINVAVAVLNLLPVAPFDGHIAWRILRAPHAHLRGVLGRLLAALGLRRARGTRCLDLAGEDLPDVDAATAASDLVRRAMQRNRSD